MKLTSVHRSLLSTLFGIQHLPQAQRFTRLQVDTEYGLSLQDPATQETLGVSHEVLARIGTLNCRINGHLRLGESVLHPLGRSLQGEEVHYLHQTLAAEHAFARLYTDLHAAALSSRHGESFSRSVALPCGLPPKPNLQLWAMYGLGAGLYIVELHADGPGMQPELTNLFVHTPSGRPALPEWDIFNAERVRHSGLAPYRFDRSSYEALSFSGPGQETLRQIRLLLVQHSSFGLLRRDALARLKQPHPGPRHTLTTLHVA